VRANAGNRHLGSRQEAGNDYEATDGELET